MGVTIYTLRGQSEAPRWARVDLAIKSAAFTRGLDCEVGRDTTLLREYVRFKLQGTRAQLEELQRTMRYAALKWNKDMTYAGPPARSQDS